MRFGILLLLLLALGCGGQARQADESIHKRSKPQEAAPAETLVQASATEAGPDTKSVQAAGVPDWGTRKAGCDWPGFLGPLGTGASPEKGIITPWPAEGLRIVWQMPAGSGFSMPSVSRDRLS